MNGAECETGHEVQLFIGEGDYCQIDRLIDARSVVNIHFALLPDFLFLEMNPSQ
jgi:hypothetical protein